jgi:PTH1 family peptidyl-tRNA hydrolase
VRVSDDRWLVVGLGNPGPAYAGNRHNIGFMCCDEIAVGMGAKFKRDRSRSMAVSGMLAGRPVTIAKPITFMNASGGPVAALSRFLKIPPARVVVIHDELDLPFGSIRMKLGGGDNGHNGLRSVTASLGTREYYRVRMGIGRPPGRMDPADYVLRNFTADERAELPALLGRSAEAVNALLEQGLAAAQNSFH